jgi:DNA replication protein DnaC
MLEHELPHLMPMPEPFDGYVENPARVSSTCLVTVLRNRYSVPCELAGQMVSTRLYPTRVVVVAEGTDRAMRSVSYQMSAARFPAHRDLAGFDFEASKVDRSLIMQLADLSFTEAAHNAVFIGGPGTGKTHLATAIVCVPPTHLEPLMAM